MQIYFLITGILSILYYLILVFYSRRLRSTFAVFWVILGGAHLIIGCAPLPVYMYTVLGVLCTTGWCIFIVIEARIIKAMLSRCDRRADYIIILGAQVRGKKITDSLKRRLDKGLEYLRRFPDTKVIVSGGRGPGEDILEADAMAGYLTEYGILPDRVIREGRSTSTRENLAYSSKFLDPEHQSVGIVTNGFHMYRAALIARQEGYRHIHMIPATSNPVFQINYLVREFFAVLYLMIKMYIPGEKRA